MNRIISFFQSKKHSPLSKTSCKEFIESLIVHKQIKEFSLCLRRKDDRRRCYEAFFSLLPTILDEDYMSNLFQLIIKESHLTSNQLSTITVYELSRAILARNFDLCEKILRLPTPSLQISLPTFEFVQLIHKCSDKDQLFRCLTILIEKNLAYDSEYLLWILIIIFEHYVVGDEIIVEYILNMKKHIDLLSSCFGNNSITPLMLFFHLYSNQRCQVFIDDYLSNVNDLSVLLQCDKWNRSYLMHLLCSQCQHESDENPSEILSDDILDLNNELIDQCPHASAVVSKFSMLYKLGNRCDAPVKTILISRYCLPLRILLFNFLLENDPLIELKFDEFFLNFPSKSIPNYSNYLKRLVRNHNLNSTLAHILFNIRNNGREMKNTIEFLLQQGARIDNMNNIDSIINYLLTSSNSIIPFMLLDYSLYIDIPFEKWLTQRNSRIDFYICRLIQCGYPTEFRAKFDEFKSKLPKQTVELIDRFIDLKNPRRLSCLCLQKLRGSLKNLGDKTKNELKYDISDRLRQLITSFGHDECSKYFQLIAQ